MSIFSSTTEGEEALAAATAETVLHLIGSASIKAKIIEWGVSFDGTNPSAEPVVVAIYRTTADDGTATACSELKFGDPDDPTALLAVKRHFTVEPTKDSLPLVSYEVHPQAGIVIQYPLGREIGLDNSASAGVAIVATAPAVVNCQGYIIWEE